MRLSDIVGSRVVTEQGDELGTVSDVRLVRGGPIIGSYGNALAIDGIIVSPRRAGNYLGYERSDMRRPALVRAVVRWLHRKSVYVDWADVRRDGEGRLTVTRPRSELRPPAELPPRTR
jgi:hypothetical protein